MNRDDIEIGANRLNVRCRAQSGAVADLEVLDISAGGCMVASKGWDAEPGERVMATLSGLSVQPGFLVWLADGRAGIAFEQPLHTAVYDHLTARLQGRAADLHLAGAQARNAADTAAVSRRKLY